MAARSPHRMPVRLLVGVAAGVQRAPDVGFGLHRQSSIGQMDCKDVWRQKIKPVRGVCVLSWMMMGHVLQYAGKADNNISHAQP